MSDYVTIEIPVRRDVAELLHDKRGADRVGRLVSEMLRPTSPASDPLAALTSGGKGRRPDRRGDRRRTGGNQGRALAGGEPLGHGRLERLRRTARPAARRIPPVLAARLDAWRNPCRSGGYILDVQTGLLEHLNTRAVVPLLPGAAVPPPIRDLNPVFAIDVIPHVILTQAIASIPTSELRRRVTALAQQRDQVTRAPTSCSLVTEPTSISPTATRSDKGRDTGSTLGGHHHTAGAAQLQQALAEGRHPLASRTAIPAYVDFFRFGA